jgi:hypothetical protein
MSFIIANNDTSVFRVEISNVVFLQNRPDPNQSDFFYSINFDNFRREDSPKAKAAPRWEDNKILFLYSTKYVDQLISKYLTIGINCSHSAGGSTFAGQAAIDLLTLATGPLRVVLTTTDGDYPTGKIQLHVDMREVMDCAVTLSEVVVSNFSPSGPLSPSACTLSVVKHGSDDGARGLLPVKSTANEAEFAVPVQRFGLDADMLLDGHCGLLLSIGSRGGSGKEAALGSTRLDFSHIFSLYSTGSFSAPEPSISNSSITSMLSDKKQNFTYRHTSFLIARDLTVDGTAATATVASVKFNLSFDGLPIFSQMRDGIVIDGRVWKGKTRDGFPPPPFMIED